MYTSLEEKLPDCVESQTTIEKCQFYLLMNDSDFVNVKSRVQEKKKKKWIESLTLILYKELLALADNRRIKISKLDTNVDWFKRKYSFCMKS